MKYAGRFLRVKNLDRYQHYKDRTPPWIKLHQELLEDYDFGCLQDASKAHALCIMLLASRLDNRIPADAAWIGKRINATEAVDIDALLSCSFLEVYQDASAPQAEREQGACVETEGETEGETEEKKLLLAPSAASRPGKRAAAPPRSAPRGHEFTVWYGAYPRKVGRQAAFGEWEKLAKSGALPPLDELLGRLKLHAASPRWQNGTIPDPRTYLHQRRWEDDPASLVAIGSNGNGGYKRPLTRHQEKRASGYDPSAPAPKVSRVENVWLTMTEEERQAWGAMTDEERRQWNADHGHAH